MHCQLRSQPPSRDFFSYTSIMGTGHGSSSSTRVHKQFVVRFAKCSLGKVCDLGLPCFTFPLRANTESNNPLNSRTITRTSILEVSLCRTCYHDILMGRSLSDKIQTTFLSRVITLENDTPDRTRSTVSSQEDTHRLYDRYAASLVTSKAKINS